MTAAELFDQRRAESAAALERIGATLAALPSADPAWRARLQPIVSGEVARLGDRLQGLSPREWAALSDVDRRSERLAAETLALAGGMAARSAGLDRGMCDDVDALLAELGPKLNVTYRPITIPASGEYINMLSEVIRVRHPGRGLWDVPIALHEFGHFLVDRLRMTEDGPSPAGVIARERADRPYLGNFAEELWADVVASYVGGPAYVSAALGRLDAVRAHEDHKPSHPAAMTRACAMLVALDHLQAAWRSSRLASGSLESAIDLCRRGWDDRLRAAGEEPEPEAAARDHATRIAEELLHVLDREVPLTRFSDGRAATRLARSLLDGSRFDGDASLVDVVNGAWWARRRLESTGRPDRIDEIDSAVTAIYGRIRVGG